MSKKTCRHHQWNPVWVTTTFLTISAHICLLPALAAGQQAALAELSLEELMDVEVTSASRKPQRAGDVAAAVFVITQDDIRRSGATSVPEVLRMAPGVEVARIDANKWAVTARGFNGRFANKLLVLLDGRSMYTRLFSGVFWDTLDTELADIDRIEVIRGPGAAVWGANAVNGVINIITKPALETQGAVATVGTGGEERGFGSVRYGGELSEGQGHYRVYGKYLNRDGGLNAFTGQPSGDASEFSRAGLRLDYALSSADSLTIHGGAHDGSSGETVLDRSLDPRFVVPINSNQSVKGGNVLARWERTSSEQAGASLQGYFSHTTRRATLFGRETRTTADFEFQQRSPIGARHDLVWGASYRNTHDDVSGSFAVLLDPASTTDHVVGSYVQDEISLVPDHLRLTVGARLDHTNYSGYDLQPSARLLWKLTDRQTVWTALSRATRTPSRGDRTAQLTGLISFTEPPTGLAQLPLPLVTLFRGNDQMGSERVSTFEVGYRAQPQDRFGLDVTAFYSDYDDLRSVTVGSPTCQPLGVSITQNPFCFASAQYLELPAMFGNDSVARMFGLEASADWRHYSWLRIQPSYSYLGRRSEESLPSPWISLALLADGLSPSHQFSLRTGTDISRVVKVDGWLRFVDELAYSSIAKYTTLDARVAWQALPNLEVSVVGQNLLDASHSEFVSELGDIPLVEIQRSAYLQIRWGR